MPECAGGCGKTVTGAAIIYIRRPVLDDQGRKQKDEHGRTISKRLAFERNCASKEITPDFEKTDRYVIRLRNTWERAFELDSDEEPLDDLVAYDAEAGRRDGRLWAAWILKIRGDVHRARSSIGELAAELEYRITRLLLRQIYRLFPKAHSIRRVAVEDQLADLGERWLKAGANRAEIEKAREAQKEPPIDPQREFRRAASGMYRLARSILDEIGISYTGKLMENLSPLSREVLRTLKGSKFEMEELESETDEEEDGAEQSPEESGPKAADTTPTGAEQPQQSTEEQAESDSSEEKNSSGAEQEAAEDANGNELKAAIELLMAMPRKQRVIEVRQKRDAVVKQQQRAEELMQNFLDAGGSFFPADAMAQVEAAADNGGLLGDIPVKRRGKKKEKTTTN